MTEITATEALTTFIDNHPNLCKEMKSVDHSYQGEGYNIYHLEGSIWAHTMMVLKEAAPLNSTVMNIAALCHDIGKPFVYVDIDKSKRRRFSNHEAVSTFYTKEVLKSYKLSAKEQERILFIVAQHGSLYNYFKDGRIAKEDYIKIADKFTYEQFSDLITFYKCDHNGRFHLSKPNPSVANGDIYSDFECILSLICDRESMAQPQSQSVKNNIIVFVGPPRAGKSTFRKKRFFSKDTVIISRDDTLMEFAQANNILGTYSAVWKKLSDEDHKTIDQVLYSKYQSALKNNYDIVIDMTNLSKKSRRKWLSDSRLKTYNKESFVFIESLDTLLSRNTKDKFIPEDVIKGMMKRFSYPQYDEFDKITLIN